MTAASAGVQPLRTGHVALRFDVSLLGHGLLVDSSRRQSSSLFSLPTSLSLLALTVCAFRNRVSTLRPVYKFTGPIGGRQSALRTTKSPSLCTSAVSCHSAVRCASSCCSRSKGSFDAREATHGGVSRSGLCGFPFPLAFPMGVRCGCIHGCFLVTEKVTRRVVRHPVGWSFHGTGSDKDHSSQVAEVTRITFLPLSLTCAAETRFFSIHRVG